MEKENNASLLARCCLPRLSSELPARKAHDLSFLLGSTKIIVG